MICNDDLCITYQIENLGCYIFFGFLGLGYFANVRSIVLTNEFARLSLLADVRPIDFSFSVYFRPETYPQIVYRSLAPDLQTSTTFSSFIQIR